MCASPNTIDAHAIKHLTEPVFSQRQDKVLISFYLLTCPLKCLQISGHWGVLLFCASWMIDSIYYKFLIYSIYFISYTFIFHKNKHEFVSVDIMSSYIGEAPESFNSTFSTISAFAHTTCWIIVIRFNEWIHESHSWSDLINHFFSSCSTKNWGS